MKMIIDKSKPDKLVLKLSHKKEIYNLIFTFLFFTIWYGMLIHGDVPIKNPIMWLFWFAPLSAIFQIIESYKLITKGEVFIIDKKLENISRNGKEIGKFKDIDRVQIRTIHDSDGDDEFRLSLVSTLGEKSKITQSNDYELATNIAEEVADFLNVEIVKK